MAVAVAGSGYLWCRRLPQHTARPVDHEHGAAVALEQRAPELGDATTEREQAQFVQRVCVERRRYFGDNCGGCGRGRERGSDAVMAGHDEVNLSGFEARNFPHFF